ncbi:MAG: nucleotidyltransferase family protein [Desulfuromonadaceae bacterium]|nr:nucleotidyltransferase family protein [Desulfuromonadaceae bacterium]
MEKEQTLKVLSRHFEEIRHRFGVESLAFFGSVARGGARPDSDLDVLVTFKQAPGLFGFLELKHYLEQLMSCPVDLVTEKALKKQLKEEILRQAIRVH